MFTRRHFKATAEIIAAMPMPTRHAWATHFAVIFAGSNERFDKGNFYAACGVNPPDEHAAIASAALFAAAELYPVGNHASTTNQGVKTWLRRLAKEKLEESTGQG